MENTQTKDIILQLIEDKKYKAVREMLEDYNTVDLAEILMELDDKDLAIVFRMIDKEVASEVFSYMDDDQRQYLINVFTDREITEILENMYTDDAVDFLDDMPANVVTKLLSKVNKDTRADINRLLQYPEDSAGSIMTVEYVELQYNMDISEALDAIRRQGLGSETVYTCYVVERKELKGIVTAKELMTNEPDVLIKDIMLDNFVYIRTTDDKEDAAKLFHKYGLIAIPVIDTGNRMVGIVTFDDAIDVLQEETTEDIHKMAAIEASDDTYLKMGVFEHVRHRIIWLIVLMLIAGVTGFIIKSNEKLVSLLPALFVFLPTLMDTGGNAGSQSATLIIRGLSVDELDFSDFLSVLWKEIRVGFIIGIILAILEYIIVYFVSGFSIPIGIAVSVSLLLTVIVSKLIGCSLPMLASKVKLDPAIMASPVITTIVDICSIAIYFAITVKLVQ
ncbi:MAG: magnesium transporter [Lachnospiraceae bacterium]|jgi:magnesium transporter|nr:magnesium transporter [Lachnospiraceae bacterium]